MNTAEREQPANERERAGLRGGYDRALVCHVRAKRGRAVQQRTYVPKLFAILVLHTALFCAAPSLL